MKPRKAFLTPLVGLVLITAPAMSQTISQVTADGQTFDAYFEDHDGQEWILIGRGREGWQFDSDGQGLTSEVSQNVGTTAAFAPKCYSDAIVNDLLDQAGITDVANAVFRLSRASDTTGTVEFQDVRWTNLSGNGGNFTWVLDAGSGTFSLDMEYKNAPAGLNGAAVGTVTGANSRDSGSNDSRRVFTWAWGGHNNEKGFSMGQTITGEDNATSFLWDHPNNGNNHAIPYTEVYIPFVSGPDETAPLIAATDPVDDSVDAPIGAPLVATFDEDIALTGSGTITLTDLTDATDNRTITLPDTGVTVSESTLSIDAGALLENSTEYEVTIDALAIEDQAAIPNAYAGTTSGQWTFTTVAADATAPVISTLLPLDDETAAGPADNLVITFDEDVLLNSSASQEELNENFNSGNGGFTVKVTGQTGTTWEYGTPDSSGIAGNAVTDDAGGGGQCWGTGLGDFTASGAGFEGYYDDVTITCLRSPVIDLTGAAAAELTFREALDIHVGNGDTTVVRLIDDTSDAEIAVIHTSVDGDVNNSPWEAANGGAPIDLSAGLGQLVRIEWCLTGVTGGTNDYLGWYIDDVLVTSASAGNSIILKNLTAATQTVIPVDDSSQVSVSGAVVTIDPVDLLAPGADFAIQIGATAIRNYNDLDFAGIADDTTWNFTTAADAVFVASATTGVNNDSWTEATNWDIGAQPSGLLTATIQTGLTALANSNAVVTYSGGLTIEENATLQIGSGGNTQNQDESALAIGTGPITMEAGSKIQWQMKVSPTIPDLTLNGDASIVTASNESHARNFNFSEISGPGQLTFLGVNNQTHTFDTASPSWSGGFVAGVSANARTRFVAAAEGVFGTGDVTIGDLTDLQINNNNAGAGNAIDDAATLNIDGSGRDQSPSTKLILNGSETVNQAFRNGIALQPGTWGSVGNGGTTYEASWISGSGILTVSSVAADTTPPTVVSVGSPPSLDPICGLPTIPYTITFDDEIDPSTVDASDFGSSGTAPFTIGSVTQLSGPAELGVFRVEVIPSGAGTVIFQISGTIEDFAGNPLAVPFDDTKTYTLDTTPQPAKEDITVDQTAFAQNANGNVVFTFDASASDKLVVILTGEHGFNNTAGNVTSVTYDGEPLIQAINRDPVSAGTDTIYNDLWYLDDPGAFHTAGQITCNVITRGNVTAFALSGTAPGVGATAISPADSKTVELITAKDKSILIVSHGMGGAGNTADVNNVDAVLPTIEVSSGENGSNWDGHIGAYLQVATPSLAVPTFVGGNLDGTVTIAAEFLAADAAGGAPEIAVEEPASTDIPSGGSRDFGTVTLGSNSALTFTIRNTGSADLNLTGTPEVDITGANAADFSVSAAPSTPVTSGGGTTTFTVQFSPAASGARTAQLSIASDDADENPFLIDISGTGQTAYQEWSGGADFEVDTNGDGVNNGLAWLLGAADPNADATGLLPDVSEDTGKLVLSFTCLKVAGRGGATLNVQYSNDLGAADLWATDEAEVPDTTSTVGTVDFTATANANPDLIDIVAEIPAGAAAGGKLFGRLSASE